MMWEIKEKLVNKWNKLPITVKTSLLYLVCSVLHKGIAFIAVPIYTRLVPANQYGIYSLYQSWDSILCVFATLNMWNYVFNNGMIKYGDRKDEFTSALIGLSSLSTTLLSAVFLFTKDWFLEFSGLPLLAVALMFIDFYFRPSYEYWAARQRFEYNVGKYAVSAIAITLLTPIITIVFILIAKREAAEELGIAIILGKVVCASLIYIIVFFSLIKRTPKVVDTDIWRYVLRFNVPLIPHFLSGIILSQSDRIMIGIMCGKDEVAIYSVAYSVASVLLIVNTAVMDTMIPWTYKSLEAKDYKKLPMVSLIALLAIVILNFIVALCAPEIIQIMAPEEYRSAVYIIPPVAISNVFIFMFNLYANIEYYYEQTKLVAMASCGAAIINIVLNYIFINIFGFVAAGYTTVVCYVIYAFGHFCFMKYVLHKYAKVKTIYNNQLLWMTALASVVLTIAIEVLYPYLWIRLLIIFIFIVIFVLKRKEIFRIVKEIRGKKL